MTESITVTGTLGGDPELRFLPSGQAVASFSIADTPRRYVKERDEWVDGETMWLRCTAWGRDAENVAETLTKGTRVIVIGKLRQNNFEDKNTGQKRSSIELTVSEIGPSLKFATARVSKNERNGGGNRGGGGGRGQASSGGQQDDPWGSSSYAQFGGDDEPPF